MRPFAWLLLTLCALGSGCGREEAGLHVVVDGTLVPGTDFDRLVVTAYLADTGTPLGTLVLEGPSLKLPASFNFVSGPGTPPGTQLRVDAHAEQDAAVVASARGEGTLAKGLGGHLALKLPDVTAGPTAPVEICDNQVDDDGDGAADCADPDCAGQACTGSGLLCAGGVCGCEGNPVGTWGPVVSGLSARRGGQAVRLLGGERGGWVVLAAGQGAAGAQTTVDLLDPKTNHVDQVPTARADPVPLSLADGTLLLIGGTGGWHGFEWRTFGAQAANGATDFSPPFEVTGARATLFDQSVVLTGGTITPQGQAPRSDLAVRLALDASGLLPSGWQSGRLGGPRIDAAARIGDWLFLASGPYPDATSDLIDGSLSALSGPILPSARSHVAVAPLPGGRALVAGGTLFDGTMTAEAFIVRRVGDGATLSPAGPLPAPMGAPTAVPVGNGWVYLADEQSGSAAFFDPASERFVPAAQAPEDRTLAARIGLGQSVLISGGGATAQDTARVLQLSCAAP